MSYHRPVRRVHYLSQAFEPLSHAMAYPRPVHAPEAQGPRLLAVNGLTGFGSYFSPNRRLEREVGWDTPTPTMPGLSGTGLGYSIPSAQDIAQPILNALSPTIDAALNKYLPRIEAAASSAVDRILPKVESAAVSALDRQMPRLEASATNSVKSGVLQAVTSAKPQVQAIIGPLEKKATAGVTLLAVLQVVTLLGVVFLAAKAAKKA